MHIIGYARVSSREQAENSHALEQQIARLEAAGATHILSDVESGSRDTRPNFNELLDNCREQKCQEVVVTRLDRLTRSLPTLRRTLEVIQKSGVNLRALDDSIDLSTAAGKFHLNMLGALAEMEVDRLSERVRHGWEHLRNRQVAMNSPFGYCKVDDGHQLDHTPFLCLLETQKELSKAAIAAEIIQAFFAKRSLRGALRIINERYGIRTFAHRNKTGTKMGGLAARGLFRFSPTGLRSWLINPTLQGHTCYLRKRDGQHRQKKDWIIHYNTHPDQTLVTAIQAQEIDQILAHNKRVKGYGSTALKYPLSGLIFCGECQGSCYSCSANVNFAKYGQSKKNYYFQCKNWRTRGCSQKKTIRMELAEAAVIEALINRAEAISDLAAQPVTIEEPIELQQLKAQLQGLEQIPGYNPSLETAKRELRSQIENLRHNTRAQAQTHSTDRDLLLEITRDPSFWRTLPDPEKQQIYRRLVDRVTVKAGQVESVSLKV